MTFPMTSGVPASVLALENAAVTAYLAAQTAINNVGILQGAPSSLLAPAVTAVEAAFAALGAALNASDMTTASGMTPVAGLDPVAFVTYLNGQIATATNSYAVFTAQNFISRVAINLALNQD